MKSSEPPPLPDPRRCSGSSAADDPLRWVQQEGPPEPPPIAPVEVPPVSPPPVSPSPQLLFRAYVAEALAGSSRDVLSPHKQQQLIHEGTRKLGLSEVFARHLLHEVAGAIGKRIVSNGPDEPPAEQVSAEALGDFLEQAAAILTQQRGVNARSRLLLAALAEHLGLSDAQMEQALQLLQESASGEPPPEACLAEREPGFREALRAGFDQLPVPVLTSRAERQWIEAGQQRYGLPPARSAELVRQAARDASLHVVSEDRVRGHIYELAADLLEQEQRLDRALQARLIAEGKQWGLDAKQVQAILQDLVHDQQRADTTRRGLISATLGGAVVLLGILALLLGTFLFAGGTARLEDDRPAAPPASPRAEEPGGPWWSQDEDLLIAVTKLRIVSPNLKNALLSLNVVDADQRAAGYAPLVDLVTQQADVRVHGPLLREFFGGCLVAEPSDACAAALADALMQLTPKVGDRLSDRERDYELSFWSVQTVSTALVQPSLPGERAALLAGALGGTLGIGIDRSLQPRDLQRQCLAALCDHLYAVILAAAPSQPRSAPPIHALVNRHAERYLDARAMEQRAIDLLASVLPVARSEWRDLEFLLQLAIHSADPLIVLRLVDLYERVSEPGLQEFLGPRLLRRAGVYPQTSRPEEVTRRVREALGAKDRFSGRQRWRQLAELAAAQEGAETEPEQRLQQVVDAAHAAALAAALAQGERGYAVFDQLHVAGPLRLIRTPLNAPPKRPQEPLRQIPSSVQQSLASTIQRLNDRSPRRESTALYLRNLAVLAAQYAELPPEHAEPLARYLLSTKSEHEHQAVLQHAEALARWHTVRLCLMDQVLDTNTNKQRVVEVISRVVRRDLAPEGPRWRAQLRDALLRSAIEEPALLVRGPDTGRSYDDLGAALCDLYLAQARLLGVPADRSASAATAADALQRIVEISAGRAAAAPANAGSPGTVDDWKEQLVAIDYAAGDELQRTVLLQRLWLEVLMVGLIDRGSLRSDQADALFAALRESDRQAVDAIAQIGAGERARLQLWLLTMPPDVVQ